MNQIKILIIDDSNIVHVLLERVMEAHSEISIIGNAYDGKEGVALTKKLSPDVIIMDIGMPKMDGLEAIQEIMHEKPTPIIVFSSVNKTIVDISFKAIEYGAVELIEKPYSEDMTLLKKNIEENLLKSIKTFADFKVIRRKKSSGRTLQNISQKKFGSDSIKPHDTVRNLKEEHRHALKSDGFPMIAVAASTGGPQTIKKLIADLSKKSINASFIFLQHMADGFMKGYCEWLAESTAMPVVLAGNNDIILPGVAYIAPGEYHLIFSDDGRFKFLNSPPIQGIRPSADIMFSSIGEVFKNRAIGVILTGMGSDGTEGLKKLKECGGYVISQDEKSSLIFGMPKSAIEAGVVDSILNIDKIADFLEKLCNERFMLKK